MFPGMDSSETLVLDDEVASSFQRFPSCYTIRGNDLKHQSKFLLYSMFKKRRNGCFCYISLSIRMAYTFGENYSFRKFP
jgi:hypothetical protein